MPASQRALALLLLSLLCGCATTGAGSSNEPILTGWVQSAGEIRVYPRKEDLGRLYDRSCYSGVMSRSRVLSPTMQNKHVAVYGIWLSAAELDDMRVKFESIGAENYCGADKLFIAGRVVALE